MTYDKVPWNGWVLVCDGSKALIIVNDGDPDLPNFRLIEAHCQPIPPARELGDDRPGRSYQSVGNARSSIDQVDHHQAAEREFLTGIAARMDQLAQDNPIKSLTLVAPPKALGLLRECLSPLTQARVTGELNRDLTHLPLDEIGRHLKQ